MFGDNLAFYSDDEVHKMFQEWGTYYDLLDRMGIEDEQSPEALRLYPHIPFSFHELQREILSREMMRDMD